MAKQVKSRTDYLQSEQFNLIKKAVSTITCLEDLVNIALAKLDSSGKEVTDTIAQLKRANLENQVSSYPRLTNLLNCLLAFQRVVRIIRTGS